MFLLPAVSSLVLSSVVGVMVDAGIQEVVYAGLHAVFASALIALLMAQTKNEKLNPFVSPSFVMLLITVLYFYLSSYKYYVFPVYPSFITDPASRLVGSLCTGGVIALMIVISGYVGKKWPIIMSGRYNALRLYDVNVLFKSLLLCLPLHLINAYCMFLVRGMEAQEYANMPYWVVVLLALGKVNLGAIFGLASLILAICIFRRDESFWLHPISVLFSVFVLLSSVVITILGQVRHVVLFAVVAMLVAVIQVRREFGRWMMIMLFIIMPFLLVVGTGFVTSHLKGVPERYQNLNDNITGFTYRIDLSDFAWSLYSVDGVTGGGSQIVMDAVICSLPGAIVDNKEYLSRGAYVEELEKVGFLGADIFDYPDTYFSLGVLIWGRPGFYLIPVLILLALLLTERLAMRVSSRLLVYPLFLVMFSFLFLRIESDLAYLTFFRSYLILFVVYMPFCFVFSLFDRDSPPLRR